MGRYLRDVWFHHHLSACMDTIVRCAHLAAMVWLDHSFRQCRSTLMVSILESGSGVGANMHAALGHCFTRQSCARFAPGAAHGAHYRHVAGGPEVVTHAAESCTSQLVVGLQPLRGAAVQHGGTGVDFLFRSLQLYLPRNPDWEGDMHLERG